MKELFDITSESCSVLITKKYSTSFSIAVRLLSPTIRQGIYNIYGFVRVADEIVDSFQGFPQEDVLNRFENEYRFSTDNGISSNPVIHAFQNTKSKYNIDDSLVEAFLKSMRTDLTKQVYSNQEEMNDYIYGSADVVGLMCLKVFVNGHQKEFERLKLPAMKLGTAFQKVNFLRDFQHDYNELSRTYFPDLDPENLSAIDKDKIVAEIQSDFQEALIGIRQLPQEARFGVYVAYKYYLRLLQKIDRVSAKELKQKRIRVSNKYKTYLLFKSYLRFKINVI